MLNRMKNSTSEAIGWVGVICIITAYAVTTLGFGQPEQPLFLILNGVGAIGIVIDGAHQRNWQPVVLNIFWFIIAVVGLCRYLLT